jgi:hypothetical protein
MRKQTLRQEKCVQHSEVLIYYCMECNVPVCSHCLIKGQHVGHKAIDVGEAYTGVKRDLEARISGVKEKTIGLHSRVQTLEAVIHNSDEQIQKQLLEVDLKFAEIEAALMERKQQLREQVQAAEEKKINQLREEQSCFYQMANYLKDSISTAEHQMAISDGWQLLDTQQLIPKKIDDTSNNLRSFEQQSAQCTKDDSGAVPLLDDSLLQHIAQYAEPRRPLSQPSESGLTHAIHNAPISRSPRQTPASPHSSPADTMQAVPPVSVGQALQSQAPQQMHPSFFSQGAMISNGFQQHTQAGQHPSGDPSVFFGSVAPGDITNWHEQANST